MWHDSLTYVTWLIDICDMTHLHVTWLIDICDMTHLHMWHDSLTYVTWLIYICDMTHWHMWHDSFTYVTWLIDLCDMTHLHVSINHATRGDESCHTCNVTMCVRCRPGKSCHTCEWVMSHMWRRSVTRVNESYRTHINEPCHTCVWTMMHMCDMTHAHVWHDSLITMTHTHDLTHLSSCRTRSFLEAGFGPLYPSFVWFVPLIRTKRVFWISTRTRPRS